MFILAITGDFNAGKSTVRRLLEQQGWAGIDCDAVVHGLYRPGGLGNTLIKRLCGKAVFFKNGRLNRFALAKLLLAHPSLRKKVEIELHPLVLGAVKDFITDVRKTKVCVEIPVYYPQFWDSLVDGILSVTASVTVVRKRLSKKKLHLQSFLAQKRHPQGAFVIHNTKNRAFLRMQMQNALVHLKVPR